MNVLKDAVRPFSGIIGEKFQEPNGQVRTGDDVMKTRAFDPIEEGGEPIMLSLPMVKYL